MTTMNHPFPASGKGAPPWAIAKLYPTQGYWSEKEFLDLSERTNRIIEMVDGCVKVLDLPSLKHQEIIGFLCQCIREFVRPDQLGKVVVAAYPLRLNARQFREPDVLFVLTEHLSWFGEKFATGADLVIEVVSEDRVHDLETKRSEYEQAGIPEYWIVDPRDKQITVLQLADQTYKVAGEYGEGGRATSVVLPGFALDVSTAFSET